MLVNSDAHVAQVRAADGLHLPSASLMRATARGRRSRCAAPPVTTRAELVSTPTLGLDFVVLGPVLPTRVTRRPPAGLGGDSRALLSSYRLPVYALGGMLQAHLEHAWNAGAHGVAMMRAL